MSIVGGGLAGMSAAAILAESGFRVSLFERSSRLGGRASSGLNRRLGVSLDVGQHVLLGCCVNLIDFHKRIGALDRIAFHESIAFLDAGGRNDLRAVGLPEPLHLLPSLVALRQLRLADKMRALTLLRGCVSPSHAETTTRDWLLSLGQSKTAMSRFWEPILTGALNDTLDRASSRYAAMVIRQAMMLNREGLPVGVSTLPLGELHGEIAGRWLASRGVSVRLREPIARMIRENGRVVGVETRDGEIIQADYCIVTSSHARLVDADLAKSAVGGAPELSPEPVPIATLYLWYRDRLDLPPVICMPGGYFHWCIDRTGVASSQPPGTSTSLALVASACRGMMRVPPERIREIGIAELREALGRALPEPIAFSVVKHPRATFSPSVGCDDIRPGQLTAIDNLFLGGDWTSTGWPGTMEGAVRSGYICAREILRREGIKSEILLPELQPRGLCRFLAR